MHVVMPMTRLSHHMRVSLRGGSGYWQHGLESCMHKCGLALLQASSQCLHNANFYTMLGTALDFFWVPTP